MDFEQYQKVALASAIYPNQGSNFVYPVLGLVGEAGEVAEKVKKILRDKGGVLDEASRAEIAKELGDVLWYIAAMSAELGVPLEKIVAGNIAKLTSRKERGVLSGSGDNR